MRFAGSNLSFTDFTHSGAGGQGVGQAADLASLGDTFASYRQSAPSYGKVAQTNLAARGHEKRAALTAEANTVAQGMQAEASVKANKIAAEAAKAAARDQASGAMMGSALSAIGTIGGALIMSDERTKNTVERIEDALTVLRELKPVSFYYNEEYSSNPERLHYGFIAQDYQKVMPDATYFDESIGKLCIDTNELIGLLVRSVQQLETRLTRMEAKQALAGVK
jgi:hypothetical protein